jgi:hypothetical protein
MDCGETTWGEEYAVHNHLWDSVTVQSNHKGQLHIACLERRLGRRLTRDDFIEGAPINKKILG